MSAPQLIIDPNVVDYGELLEDVAYATGLTLRNISDAEDLNITNVDTDTPDITFPGLSVPFTLGPGESVQLDIEITPANVGAVDRIIAITSNSITSVDVANVSYEGIAAGTKAISVSPTAQTFPDTKAGEQSDEIIFTVTCTGSVATTVTSITFPTDFVAGGTVPTLPDTLNPEETLTFGVKFAPSAQGFIEGVVEVVSDAAASPFEVEVSGMGFLIESAYPVGPIEPEAFVVGLLSEGGDAEVWQSTPAASHLTQLNCESEASLAKMLNFGAFADKLIRFFWMHFEDLGEGTVTISLENQMTGVVQSYTRTVGEGEVPPERILRDMFEVLLEAENVLVRITKTASSGALSIIDYGLRYLPSQEARGTLANPTTITPAYVVNQCPEMLQFGLIADDLDVEVHTMDVLTFVPESPAHVKNAVLLPFPTDQGPIPGFTYEKQVMRVFFHYEDFGPAVVTVAVTTMRGQISSQNVALGTADGDVGCVQIGIADLLITDEVHEVRFIHVSGVVSILDYTVKYEIKGEREKTTPVESLVGCDRAPLAIAPCVDPLVASCTDQFWSVGVPSTYTLTFSGGVTPYHFELISGGFPDGVTLNEDTGVISGTPTESGTFPYTVRVSDSSVPTQSIDVSCEIEVAQPIPEPVSGIWGILDQDASNLYVGSVNTSVVGDFNGTRGRAYRVTKSAFTVTSLLLNANAGIVQSIVNKGNYVYTLSKDFNDLDSIRITKIDKSTWLSVAEFAPGSGAGIKGPVHMILDDANNRLYVGYPTGAGSTLGLLRLELSDFTTYAVFDTATAGSVIDERTLTQSTTSLYWIDTDGFLNRQLKSDFTATGYTRTSAACTNIENAVEWGVVDEGDGLMYFLSFNTSGSVMQVEKFTLPGVADYTAAKALSGPNLEYYPLAANTDHNNPDDPYLIMAKADAPPKFIGLLKSDFTTLVEQVADATFTLYTINDIVYTPEVFYSIYQRVSGGIMFGYIAAQAREF